MGFALELIGWFITNPGGTLTAATPSPGDSFTVRNFNAAAPAYLENAWVQQETAGVLRIRSPRMHDNLQNLRFNIPITTPFPLFPDWLEQVLYPQDLMVVEQTGGGAGSEAGAMMVWYGDLPGTQARLFRWSELQPRVRNYVSVVNTVTSSATIGTWAPGQALNATFDTLKANVDYAVLGYDVDVNCAAVALRGIDTGNLRVGGPGALTRIETRDWFVRQSVHDNMPSIPVINAANKGSIVVDVLANTASLAVNVNWILAELAP